MHASSHFNSQNKSNYCLRIRYLKHDISFCLFLYPSSSLFLSLSFSSFRFIFGLAVSFFFYYQQTESNMQNSWQTQSNRLDENEDDKDEETHNHKKIKVFKQFKWLFFWIGCSALMRVRKHIIKVSSNHRKTMFHRFISSVNGWMDIDICGVRICGHDTEERTRGGKEEDGDK